MNEMMMYVWGIKHGILFKGRKSGGGAGYSGPSEAEMAARRAEDRAENNRLRQLARLEALADQRRAAEEDVKAQSAAKLTQDQALAAREAKEEMVGDEAAGQADVDSEQAADIMSAGERYGSETRPGGTRENRVGVDKKKKKDQ